MNIKWLYFILCLWGGMALNAQQTSEDWLQAYNPYWTTQSKNSSESMPCGGGDIGMNVWVENDEVLLYISRSGTFDENNVFMKLGRIRLSLQPNPFKDATFRQELKLREGYVEIEAMKNGKRTVVELSLIHISEPTRP